MPNFIQVQPNSSGLLIDTSELVVSTNTVERQNISIADPVVAANIVSVVTKGTQGAYAATTQDIKDGGRTTLCFTGMDQWAVASTTEAVVAFNLQKGQNALLTAQTAYTVTTGKTLRIQAFSIWSYNSTASGSIFNVRANPSGTAVLTSNVILPYYGVPTNWLSDASVIFPDGFEIAGGTSICFTQYAGGGSGNQIYGSFTGYEY